MRNAGMHKLNETHQHTGVPKHDGSRILFSSSFPPSSSLSIRQPRCSPSLRLTHLAQHLHAAPNPVRPYLQASGLRGLAAGVR
jgi:hypothetical protein